MYRTDDPERDLYHWQKAEEEIERKYEIANDWMLTEFLTLVEAAVKAASVAQLDALAVHSADELLCFYDHVSDELQKPDHPVHFTMSALLAGDDEQVEYWSKWIVEMLEPVKVYEAYHGL